MEIAFNRPWGIFKTIFRYSYWECWIKQNYIFSFDDGPSEHTIQLLEVAKQYGLIFIFFILPKQANKFPDIVRKIKNDGHILGSHFLNHRYYCFDNKKKILQDLVESNKMIEDIIKSKIEFCRAPYGYIMPWHEQWIHALGLKHVFWSLDSKDYLHEDKEIIINRVDQYYKPNDIVLLHDGENAHPDIIEVVDECIKKLSNKK